MNIKTANALFDEGIFSEMYKAGFITAKVFTYREIYLWIQAQMQIRGITIIKPINIAVKRNNQILILPSFSCPSLPSCPCYARPHLLRL